MDMVKRVTNANGVTFKVGEEVRLKRGVMEIHQVPEGREANRTAKIVSWLADFYNGGVMMDRDLMGMQYWNIDDLEKVEG